MPERRLRHGTNTLVILVEDHRRSDGVALAAETVAGRTAATKRQALRTRAWHTRPFHA